MPQYRPTPDDTPTERIHPAADRTVPLDRRPPAEEDAGVATALDPSAWGHAPQPPTPAGPAPAAPAPAPAGAPAGAPTPAPAPQLRRFGPGVPPQTAAVWHRTAPAEQPQRPTRRGRAAGWLVWAAVLLALLAVVLTRCHTDPPLALTGVAVTAEPATGPTCGGTAAITASVATNGRAGTIRYHWLRSDGTSSGELSQPVQSGEDHVRLVLRWTFDGQGSMTATATVEILAPQRLSALTTFTYTCTG